VFKKIFLIILLVAICGCDRDTSKKELNYNQKGIFWFEKEKYYRAIYCFQQAIKKEKTEFIYLNLGKTWFELKKYNKAIIALNQAINGRRHNGYYFLFTHYNPLERGSVNCHFYRGMAFYHQKDYVKSIIDFNYAISFKNNSPLLYLWRSNAWVNKKNYKRALQDCEKALTLSLKNKDTKNEQRAKKDKKIIENKLKEPSQKLNNILSF